MMVFKSKIDWWLIVILLFAFGYPLVEGIVTKQYFLTLVMFALFGLFFLLFYSLKYKIEKGFLMVWTSKIDIKTIKKIYRTRNPLSSPALSLDRIAITYNKYDEILLSPKERETFINELLKINPDIIVEV